MHRWISRVAIAIPILTFACILAILGVGQLATRATPSDVGKLASNEQEIPLTAGDDVRIATSFFPVAKKDAPVILMLHGNGASRA